jgi:hypothetical protein
METVFKASERNASAQIVEILSSCAAYIRYVRT